MTIQWYIRVGHELDSSINWIELDWIGLDPNFLTTFWIKLNWVEIILWYWYRGPDSSLFVYKWLVTLTTVLRYRAACDLLQTVHQMLDWDKSWNRYVGSRMVSWLTMSVTRVDQSKTVQARITQFSPSAAWKTLVSGTVKLSYKFEGGHPERRGGQNLRFLANNSLYLSNGAR